MPTQLTDDRRVQQRHHDVFAVCSDSRYSGQSPQGDGMIFWSSSVKPHFWYIAAYASPLVSVADSMATSINERTFVGVVQDIAILSPLIDACCGVINLRRFRACDGKTDLLADEIDEVFTDAFALILWSNHDHMDEPRIPPTL